ncbi:MAG: arginase [Planctomycetota bacterium]
MRPAAKRRGLALPPERFIAPREIRLIGVPMDLGAGRRGVDMGPSAMRLAGLEANLEALGHRVTDTGDIPVPIPEVRKPGPGPKYLREILAACDKLARKVERILEERAVPIVLGGDHSIALGTVTGLARHFRRKGREFGLLYVDAHGDMNTPESSPSGNVHGMPLAAVLGLGSRDLVEFGGFSPKAKRERTALLGIRNVDEAERGLILKAGIAAYTMRDLDERGMPAVVREALAVVTSGTEGFHLSFDLDSLDPTIAPGTGTPVRGGIGYREAHLLMELVADTGHLVSMEVAELNPVLDDRNVTGQLAVDLILSAFGKRIL